MEMNLTFLKVSWLKLLKGPDAVLLSGSVRTPLSCRGGGSVLAVEVLANTYRNSDGT
jgi:hypothetical protein